MAAKAKKKRGKGAVVAPKAPPKKPGKYETLLREASKSGHDIAADLAELADSLGMTPAAVANRPELLVEAGLDSSDVGPLVVHQADKIDQEHREWWQGFGQPKKLTTEEKPEKQQRVGLFGHPITAIIRWMGSDAWDFSEARAAFDALKIDIANGTIRVQLRNGRKDIGEIPPLTDDQIEKLYEAAESL